MHRGHWNEASGSAVDEAPGACELLFGPVMDSPASPGSGRGRKGSGEAADCRLVALDIAAFSTWARVGLMPHAKHGGSGVCSFAAAGSKLEGTGLEKLQIVQTHVAVLVAGGSTGGVLNGLSARCGGDVVRPREGMEAPAGDRDCSDMRFVGFGIRVIFADDFRKPAWGNTS